MVGVVLLLNVCIVQVGISLDWYMMSNGYMGDRYMGCCSVSVICRVVVRVTS